MLIKAITGTFLFVLFVTLFNSNHTVSQLNISKPEKMVVDNVQFRLYDSLKLSNLGLSRDAYIAAIKGFNKLRLSGTLHNERVLSIVDFSVPSFKKRLFIIDIVSGRLLFNTFVSHGHNSGNEMATKFSNQFNSLQSSLGFYITGQTYRGQHGTSLRLQGMEKGINDNAFNRGIVMHGASYVPNGNTEKLAHVGRSQGCPAIPVNIHRAIIEIIKNGTCLFVYSSDKRYLAQSKYLQKLHEA